MAQSPVCWYVMAAAGWLLGATGAVAAEVAVAGVIGNRAILVVDGGAPQTVAAGARTREGVKLIAVDGDAATVEFDGRRERLRMGERVVHSGGSGVDSLTLQADSRGHFVTRGRVNGAPAQFLVDTGATLVSLGRSDAERAGIDYRKGTPGLTSTANGDARVWRVRVDTLEVGGLKVHNVDAAVHDRDLPVSLLGMSFLNRMHWQREGDKLILQKRY
ncbi:TIGR02281 family clan AA aspartic protease [Thauera sinica]|nr:TIGR02281 family clan AA aspartic protease [Thauera sp. K11]